MLPKLQGSFNTTPSSADTSWKWAFNRLLGTSFFFFFNNWNQLKKLLNLELDSDSTGRNLTWPIRIIGVQRGGTGPQFYDAKVSSFFFFVFFCLPLTSLDSLLTQRTDERFIQLPSKFSSGTPPPFSLQKAKDLSDSICLLRFVSDGLARAFKIEKE